MSSIGYRRRGWLLRLTIPVVWVLLTTTASQASDSSTSSTPDACNIGDTVPDCTPTVWGSVWISGVVTDPLAQPVVSATVSGGKQPVLTDSRGFYATEVYYRTNNPAVTLRAEKTGFDPVSRTVNAINAAVDGVDFQLFYSLSPSVSPRYFNNSPQKILTFDVVTGVGPTVGKVWVQLPGGATLDANHLYDGSDGLSRWQGQWLVPASTSDGHYGYKACGVTSLSSGNCDSISSGTLLTRVPGGIYTVDGTPPSISAVGPRPNHNTINTRPTISASLSDATSGISYGATKIYLDGVEVASGTSSYFPPSGLSLGIHDVTVTASDVAGNTSVLPWSFNVVTLVGSGTTNTVIPKTVLVNPQPHPVLYRPTSVRITGVTTLLARYEVNLSSSSLWSGYGTIQRSVPHNHLRATFNNELGQSVTVNDVADVSSVHTGIIAALEPSSGPLITVVPESVSTFSVDVAVPPTDQFVVTDESTVTVWADEQSLGSTTLSAAAGDNPIPSGISPGTYTLAVDPAMLSVVGNDTPDGHVYGLVAPSDGAVIYYPCNGLEHPLCAVRVLKPDPPPSPPSSVTAEPTCSEDGAPVACSFLFPTNRRLTMFWWTGKSLQVWASVFPIQMGDRLIFWEHVDASAQPLNSCLFMKFTRIDNRLTSEYSDWTIPSSDISSSHFAPTIGTGEAVLSLNDTGYESTRSLVSGTGSGSFTSTVTATAGSNSWCAKNVPGFDCAQQVAAVEHVEIATGATFAPPSTGSVPYRFRIEVQWWAEVEKTC